MKQKLVYLLILFIQFGFSQTYTFDKLAIYKGSDNYTNSVYCNSSDSNYFMRVTNSHQKQQANVYDIKKMKVHTFEIITDELDNDSNALSFIYSYSRKIKSDFDTNNTYEYVKLNEDDTHIYSKMLVYKNKSKKKIIEQVDLKIKKNKINYFPLYRFSVMHTLEFKTDLNFEIGGIIESSKTLNSSFENNLIEFQDFDLQLVVIKEIEEPKFK